MTPKKHMVRNVSIIAIMNVGIDQIIPALIRTTRAMIQDNPEHKTSIDIRINIKRSYGIIIIFTLFPIVPPML